jgi:hypothetical protein
VSKSKRSYSETINKNSSEYKIKKLNLLKNFREKSEEDFIEIRRKKRKENEARLLIDETEFANDLNEIVPYDDAVNNRVQCIGFSKIYVDKPEEELNAYQLKMDDNIKDQIQQLPIQQAFVKLLIKSYQDYLATGFNVPEEVKQSKNDWVGNEKSVVELFLESFKITDEKHPDIKKNYNEDMYFVKSSDIDTWLKEYKKDYSNGRYYNNN